MQFDKCDVNYHIKIFFKFEFKMLKIVRKKFKCERFMNVKSSENDNEIKIINENK